MASSFTWLDYDDAERDRFDGLLRALDDVETVDSLGVGPIRDGIANLLFPGTSTIQTRARYFLLVARDCVTVERSRPGTAAEFSARLRTSELQTLRALKLRGGDGQGIIGFRSGDKTRRLPSSVYWNGAGQWGIRRHLGRSMVDYRAAVVAGRRHDLPQGDEPGDNVDDSWWEELPTELDDRGVDGLEIVPSADEAAYLLERAAAVPAGGAQAPWRAETNSLLARAAAEVQSDGNRELPEFLFELERIAGLHPRVDLLLRHANHFSLVVQGVRLLYLRLLFDAARSIGNDLDDHKLSDYEHSWMEQCQGSAADLGDWVGDTPELFAILRGAGVGVPDASQWFFLEWIRAAVADPEVAYHDPSRREAVRRREFSLKRGNARLHRTTDLTRYGGELYGSGYLDYRWGVTRRLLEDCRSGLGAGHAGA